MVLKTVSIPIYGGKLIVTRSQEEFDRAYTREMVCRAGLQRSDESVVLCSGGMTTSGVIDNELVIITGVFDRKTSTRCHEATHCAQDLAEAIAMDAVAEKEGFAYLVQWFFEEMAP